MCPCCLSSCLCTSASARAHILVVVYGGSLMSDHNRGDELLYPGGATSAQDADTSNSTCCGRGRSITLLVAALTVVVIALSITVAHQSSSLSNTSLPVPTADQIASCIAKGRAYIPFKTQCMIFFLFVYAPSWCTSSSQTFSNQCSSS
jgi:hypothetical protein